MAPGEYEYESNDACLMDTLIKFKMTGKACTNSLQYIWSNVLNFRILEDVTYFEYVMYV